MSSCFDLQERRGKIADLWLAIRLGVFFALFSLKDTLSYFDTVKKCIGAYHSRDGGNLRLYGICGWFPAYAGMTMGGCDERGGNVVVEAAWIPAYAGMTVGRQK